MKHLTEPNEPDGVLEDDPGINHPGRAPSPGKMIVLRPKEDFPKVYYGVTASQPIAAGRFVRYANPTIWTVADIDPQPTRTTEDMVGITEHPVGAQQTFWMLVRGKVELLDEPPTYYTELTED